MTIMITVLIGALIVLSILSIFAVCKAASKADDLMEIICRK